MAVTSIVQRLIEGAFNVTLTTGRNFVGGATTRINKADSWKRRGRGNLDNWKFNSTREAWNEYFNVGWNRSLDVFKDPNRGVLRKGFEAASMIPRGVFGGAHVVMAGAFDFAGGVLGTAAGVAGHAVSIPLQIGAQATVAVAKPVIKGTLKGGWALAKGTGMTPTGVAKGVGLAGEELAKDAGALVAGTGKFLWNTRKDPLVGTGLVLGAGLVGAGMGSGDYYDQKLYGSPYGGYGTDRGYFNAQIQAPAWQINYEPSKAANAIQANLNKSAQEDNMMRGSVDPLYGPMGHDFGGSATGDLVFALHNLRSGGIL